MAVFLSLDENGPILETIHRLGEEPIFMSTVYESEATPAMPASVKSLETFVCKVHAPKSSSRILSDLPWELFRAKNLESEMLPPIDDTLIPHIQRFNCMVMRYRSYTSPHPAPES